MVANRRLSSGTEIKFSKHVRANITNKRINNKTLSSAKIRVSSSKPGKPSPSFESPAKL